MLTITDDAISVIRALTEEHESSDQAGLRIANDDLGRLTVSLVGGPADGDEIVEDSGARLFVAPDAAEQLEDMALMADVDPGGSVTFGVREQA